MAGDGRVNVIRRIGGSSGKAARLPGRGPEGIPGSGSR